MYPHLNQGKLVYLLVNFQRKLDLGVENRTSKKKNLQTWQIQTKTKKNQQNLSVSDSENEITKFPRFIAIESLEETPIAKLPSFLD